MIYLRNFSFPSEDREYNFILDEKRTCFDTFYPFKILSKNDFTEIDFEPVAILYGCNGSGKSTALNVIAEKIGASRDTIFNKSNFFKDYEDMCDMYEVKAAEIKRIITSDDVFDYILNLRNLNEGIDNKRENLFGDYLDAKYSGFKMKSLEDYEELKKVNSARAGTMSKFIRKNLMSNVRLYSNGESAYRYFIEKIIENGLYILDEPENSLSPKRQIELMSFIEDLARFFGCQFIISTHSPFLLAIKGAKIYDLDESPVSVKPWTSLENVRTYYEFFKHHNSEF